MKARQFGEKRSVLFILPEAVLLAAAIPSNCILISCDIGSIVDPADAAHHLKKNYLRFLLERVLKLLEKTKPVLFSDRAWCVFLLLASIRGKNKSFHQPRPTFSVTG
jgi:hypothetical protein